MANIGLELLGDKELSKALNALPDKMAAKVFKKGAKAGAQLIKAEVNSTVPYKTGALKKALKVRVDVSRSKGYIGYAINWPTTSDLGIDKSAGYYPSVLEFGSAKRGIAPRAYIRNAADNNRDRVLNEVASSIDDALKEFVK